MALGLETADEEFRRLHLLASNKWDALGAGLIVAVAVEG